VVNGGHTADEAPSYSLMGSARRSYLPRTAGLALGFLMLAAVLWQRQAPATVWTISVLYCFGFPHLAWWLARRAPDPRRAEKRNLLVDPFFGGLATAAMAFNVLPSVLTLSLLSMNSVAGGGPALLLRGLAWHAFGVACGVAAVGLHWVPEPTLLGVLACIPVMVVQPIAISFTARLAIRKLQNKRSELEHRGRHDGLSGLFNRSHWESLVHAEFERCRRAPQHATLVMADLDHFKRINDLHGHAAGDEAIRRFAGTLRRELRLNDAAGRYGGEEFGLLLPGTSAAAAREVIERFRRTLQEQPLLDVVPVTASFGAVELTPDIDSHTAWLRLADQMLYRAKHLGRDRIAVLGDAERDADQPGGHTEAAVAPHARGMAALDDRAVLSHLLGGFELSGSALALFDPMDRLTLANPAFTALYDVQPTARCFADVMRHCHGKRVGPSISSDDIDGWLRMADGKRRSQPHRSFTVDMVDGALYRASETSFSDGWVLVMLNEVTAAQRPQTVEREAADCEKER
jgi:diguanylate cyclase (GGDEF)-like protein